MSQPSSTTPPGAQRTGGGMSALVRIVLYVALAGAVGYVGYNQYLSAKERQAASKSEDVLVSKHGLTETRHKKLSPEYTDKEGHLVADPPSDAKKLLDPAVLVLSHYEEADADSRSVDWKAFADFLAKTTGKKIESSVYINSADDVAKAKSSEYHIIALHAADTPYLVDNAGFVPDAVLGSGETALGNKLDIAVKKDSKIQELGDLRGRFLTCTAPDSITGYRAAVAVLSQQKTMRPDVDYFVNFSMSQTRSINGLAAGDYECAALSDDKLQSMDQKKKADSSQFRLIYQSEVIPRLTIGHVYNLNTDLVDKIREAIHDFKNEGGRPDADSGKPMRFYKTDYKKDFAFVRDIDDSFDPRFSKERSKKDDTPAPEPELAKPDNKSAEQADEKPADKSDEKRADKNDTDKSDAQPDESKGKSAESSADKL